MTVQNISPQKQSFASTHDENVLVVKTVLLFDNQPQWSGFQAINIDHFINTINVHKEFLPRALMEHDVTYKQIIPYLIFKHKNRYFLMQRSNQSRENRLHNKFTLGIGGHIRSSDTNNSTDIFAWAHREFNEEINYKGSFTTKVLGIVNGTKTLVDQVHLGLVLLIEGDSDQISIKSELKSGVLATLAECNSKKTALENWSVFVLDYLNTER